MLLFLNAARGLRIVERKTTRPKMACPKDSNNIPGSPRTTKSRLLEAGASAIQDFTPVEQVCAHLNAFHVYTSDLTRCVEANHYCSHITEGPWQVEVVRERQRSSSCTDFRQCIVYDSPKPNARLIGVEYMISPRLFDALPKEERKYWHTHEYEVKSGMLVMPTPSGMLPGSSDENIIQTLMIEIIYLYQESRLRFGIGQKHPK